MARRLAVEKFEAKGLIGFAKQGANDNASGCAAILETARVIKKLADEGKTPPLKRSIRFLFVPEISGTIAYLKKYPELIKRFFIKNDQTEGNDGDEN
jgi:aminopeptidase-like protein